MRTAIFLAVLSQIIKRFFGSENTNLIHVFNILKEMPTVCLSGWLILKHGHFLPLTKEPKSKKNSEVVM